ncbi:MULTISPECIES: hypothetical protein [Calothrix]|uniref:Uncharacterized protein n=2 Tax=Calothrix TaxID=1186 RepID=A0ABR8ANK3_9CYAN|nr:MULTISPECIES: hypothetical protein [Calothrix]MBD2200212.1 hypothetical protein [Calothrix parietina FACHB-288]MBD2229185.1 hypothetical protein [Calothrix anomala FACHB-343]
MLKNSVIIVLAFASAFFPRLLDAVGFPPLINFAHLILIPLISFYIIAKTHTRLRVNRVLEMLAGLMLLFTIIVASALLNKAGLINVLLDFLLRAEWLIFLLAIISINPSAKSLKALRFWFLSFAFINILFAYVQKFILRWDAGKAAGGDYITGVFLGQGAGCDVSSGVSIIFAIYYFTSSTKNPLWIRIAVCTAAIIHIFITDAKSHFLVFLIAFLFLMLTKVKLSIKSITEVAKYGLITAFAAGGVYLASQTVARSLLIFADPQKMQDGWSLKSCVFRIIPSHYETVLNWFLGLGPGHTVGRLGGWFLKDYASLLSPLGATISPVSQQIWDAVWSTWIGPRSRLWSPFFGWAGIWGDWGLLGLAAFLLVMYIAWRRFCIDDASRLILLSVASFGLIFTQMEEPGYVISVAAIIGLRWQEVQIATPKVQSMPSFALRTRSLQRG